MDVFFIFIINQDILLVVTPCSLVGVRGYSIMYPNVEGTGYTEIYWIIWYQVTKDGIFVA
jgi:hypothetical protein